MITGENDLKNLLKLYNEVLNTNFNDKNLVVIQDKISSNLNKNIAEFMEKNNISYNDYKRISEDVKYNLKEDDCLQKLGNDKLEMILEDCSVKETVDILKSFDIDNDFIINCFSEKENQKEAEEYIEKTEESEDNEL